jgi:DNA processing protein
VTEGERLARVHLSAALEPGDPLVATAVARLSATDVVDMLLRGHDRLDPDGRKRRRLHQVDPDQVWSRSLQAGLSFVVPGDQEWPAPLDVLDSVFRDRRGGLPIGVWVRGHLEVSALRRSVAVVGSRAATAYGTAVSTDWSSRLAERNVLVVSGAAYGVDAAAHRGCLAVAGQTVAVLACGLDEAYPRGNAALIDRIADSGAVLSEAAPGTTVNRGRFLSRNRLIAALAEATVVVEAGVRSGALSTARWALDLGRPVGAVPGAVTSSLSLGAHQLVRESDAMLVSRPEEVLELVGDLSRDAAPLPLADDSATDTLSGDAAAVHEAFPARGPVTVAELMAATGIGVAPVLRALNELAGEGLVRGEGDVWARRTRATRR